MFTGLVQGVGEISEIISYASEKRFSIVPAFAMKNLQEGESIAVNGVCLSVEKHAEKRFQVYASRETMRASNLGRLAPGSKVNLERALAMGERLGGHLVSGHVDCLATIKKIEPRGSSRRIVFSFPQRFSAGVIAKGSVALDGVSLTINDCGADFFEVNIIPDSFERTNIRQWSPGCQVNMETDLIGKYILRALEVRFAENTQGVNKPRLDSAFLATHGFI